MNGEKKSVPMVARAYLFLHEHCRLCGGKKFLILWNAMMPADGSESPRWRSQLEEKCEHCERVSARSSVLNASGGYFLALADRLSRGELALEEFWARLNSELQSLGGLWERDVG